MKRKGLGWIILLLAVLAAALPVLAEAPQIGVVREGLGVPGIDLGFTRSQVEAVYGPPSSCQSVENGGDFAYCQFPVDGGGQVGVRYRGADGGPAANSPGDVAYHIRWYEQVSGWTTTAGVNTALAKNDPQAAVAVYPDAQITYNIFGAIYSLVDAQQGFEIIWAPDFYSGTTHVNMAIFAPRPPAPILAQETSVTSIDLSATKSKGNRQIIALVRVQNERQLAAAGATVFATWTLPDGSTRTAQDITSDSGYAYFDLAGRLDRGTYLLTIDDITLADHAFNRAGSQLTAAITVK